MDFAVAQNRTNRTNEAVSSMPHTVHSHPVKPTNRYVNVGNFERMLSALTGGGLALLGLKRRSLGGLALAAVGGSLLYRGVSGHCNLYDALNISTAPDAKKNDRVWERGIKLEKSITINRPRNEVYHFWRKLENLPRFMAHLKEVREIGPSLSHWTAKGPAGTTVEWGAEIINDIHGEVIAWKSLLDSDIDSAGSVNFKDAPGARGTEVRVSLQYNPPAGALGMVFAKLFGEEPEQQIDEDLRRLKQVLEAGEVPATTGQPRGCC